MNEDKTKAQLAAQISSDLHHAQRKVDELKEQLCQLIEEMTPEEVKEYQQMTAAQKQHGAKE